MEKFLHVGYLNIAFNSIIKNVSSWLSQEKSLSFGGYSSEVTRSRIIQKIVEICYPSYLSHYVGELEVGKLNLQENSIHSDKIKINTLTGEVTFYKAFFIRMYGEYFYEWLRALWGIVSTFFSRHDPSKVVGSAVLFYGIDWNSIKYKDSDRRFQQFCKESEIGPLRNFKNIIIHNSENRIIQNGSFYYVKNPLLMLFKMGQYAFLKKILLLGKHLLSPIIFFIKTYKYPPLVLLGRDFAFVEIGQFLNNEKAIEAIILTTSNFSYQPIWMREFEKRNFKTHMLHYAQNTKPFVYKQDMLLSNNPVLVYCYVDVHWVWTSGYRDYLKSLGYSSEINVVGPITFYHKEQNRVSNKPSEEIRIAVFDVTPNNASYEKKIGAVRNYYNTKNMLKFLSDIIRVGAELKERTGRKVIIELKHKRSIRAVHDFNYCQGVEELVSMEKIIKIDHDVNIYSYLENCSLVICTPYTSVAHIASILNIPCLFYDGTGEIEPSYEAEKGVDFAGSYKELISKVLNLFIE